MAGTSAVEQRIAALNAKSQEQDADLQACERDFLMLAGECGSAKDKGKVMVAIARMYSCDVPAYFEQIIQYSKESLRYPLDTVEACEMYLLWEDGLVARYSPAKVRSDPSLRSEVAWPYLRALLILLEDLEIEREVVPSAVGKFDVAPTDPSYKELRERHEEQMAARRYTEVQNKLLQYERILTRNLLGLYGSLDSEKLKIDVRRAVDDESTVERLLKSLRRKDH